MTTARSRRLATTTLALTALLSLGACGTGFDTQTNAQYQPGVGANVRTGDVQAYNTVLVDNGDDTYTLSVGLLNTTDEPQALSSYSVAPRDGGAAVTSDPSAPVDLSAKALSTIGFDGEVVVTSKDLSVGKYATIELTFDSGETLSVEAPVVARTAEYSQVASKAAQPDTETAPDTGEKDAETAEQ